jgi:predicted Zn-dependent peptidase
MTDTVERRLLANGIPLLTERLPHLRSVSMGIWVHTGSRDELPGEWGVSHFLEHTFFKGTARRNAEAVAREADALGADMNAFTSREQTAYYIKVLSDRAGEAAPEEWAHDLQAAHAWGPDSPLGRNILGTEESVAGLSRDTIRAYLKRRYGPGQIVVAVAGNLDPEALFAQVDATVGRMPAAGLGPGPELPVPSLTGQPPKLYFRDLEQAHLCVGAGGLPLGHTDRFGLYVLNDLLGGGSSSRLFQEIREKRGLAYSVYTSLGSYRDCGEMTIYAGASPPSLAEVAGLIETELVALCERPVDEEELARVKGHLKGQVVLGLESSFARMSRLAQDEFLWGGPQPIEVLLDGIDRVDAAQVQGLARHAFDPACLSATVLGALNELPRGFLARCTTPL